MGKRLSPDLPDNVVAIETKFTEAPPVDWKPRDYLACQHEHTMLDDKLRTVGCRDCGEERLDPFEVLLHLAHVWHRWHREAEQLQKLNLEYRDNQRDKWERARDRHLVANPTHSDSFRPRRRIENRGIWRSGEQPCATCDRIEQDFNPSWYPTPVPEPPPGKLTPGTPSSPSGGRGGRR